LLQRQHRQNGGHTFPRDASSALHVLISADRRNMQPRLQAQFHPADSELTRWPDGQPEFGGAKLPRWDSLSLIQKKFYARQAEIFAAYAG
jgi:hypothetical protein